MLKKKYKGNNEKELRNIVTDELLERGYEYEFLMENYISFIELD